MNRSGRSEPSGPAITPHASSGWSARACATMASTRSARITSTTALLPTFCERSGQHVTVGRYSGDRLGGQHADHHRAGQTVGRGGADGGGQLRLRRHRRRRVGCRRRPRWRRWPARTRYRRPAGCERAGWCGPAPSCAATATRLHAAGLSAASVATTAIVVFSGLTARRRAVGERGDLLGGRRDQPELLRSGRPSTATRWPGRRRCPRR